MPTFAQDLAHGGSPTPNGMPSAEWMKSCSFLPLTISIVEDGGFSWAIIDRIPQEVLEKLTGDSRISFLKTIARIVMEIHDEEVAAEYRDSLVEYLLNQDALPELLVDFVKAYAVVLSNRVQLLRARNEMAMSRRLKELFRRVIHTLIRV